MAQRIFALENPVWRAPRRLSLRLGALLAGSLLWLLLYAWLGWQLWRNNVGLGDSRTLWLIAVTIGLGVVLLLGWLRLWPTLRKGRAAPPGGQAWPPLSQAELQSLTPSEFEAYVAHRIFARQGYTVQNTADVKDGGVDIRLTGVAGNEAIVQCKRYANTVGVATVRDLYGTMIHDGARHAFLVTSGPISADAREWVRGKPINLIDGVMAAALAKAEPNSTYLTQLSRIGAA